MSQVTFRGRIKLVSQTRWCDSPVAHMTHLLHCTCAVYPGKRLDSVSVRSSGEECGASLTLPSFLKFKTLAGRPHLQTLFKVKVGVSVHTTRTRCTPLARAARQAPDRACFSSLSGSNPRSTRYARMPKKNRAGARPSGLVTSGQILVHLSTRQDKNVRITNRLTSEE